MSGKLERSFQNDLIKDIEKRFQGAIVMKNDPNYIQGIPDLTILYGEKWATLECKRHANAPAQPNQPYYVQKMNHWSFSRFVYPENKEAVLNDLEQLFASARKTRISKCK